ncbi:MAG: carboxypeptidase [Actinobacteria bacterium]|nr:carboxypeptidase [Actinomycetota bacterium]
MRTLRPIIVTAVAALAAALLPLAASGQETTPPTTEFEDNGGADWTSHQGELDFLDAVAAGSSRVRLEVLGHTLHERPLHLVTIGATAPRTAEEALESKEPVVLFVCTQHGNEPAGREACLIHLRDLAFTDDPTLIRQMQHQTILFIPTANPDGRAVNNRRNSQGIDINRDHMQLRTAEGQAIAEVIRDWQPDAAADLHEYGPSVPVFYDDEVLYLWPRNLNAHEGVRALARTLAEDYVAKGVEEDGYTAGEYGRYRALEDDYHVTQTAGDWDDGIARNALGLRHVASILLETAVTQNPNNGTGDLNTAGLQNRRVNAHVDAIDETLRFMRDLGAAVATQSEKAKEEKAQEGADRNVPLFFNGQDEDTTIDGMVLGSREESTSYADPPPCGYVLDAEQAQDAAVALALHGIATEPMEGGGVFVSMAQAAEPIIGLLLDGRAKRERVAATPVELCGEVAVIEARESATAGPALADAPVRAHLIGA